MLSRSLWLRAMTPRAALQTLGLTSSIDITHARVKKAYIAQTLLCHPDLNPEDPNATEKFRHLSEALRVALKSLEMRRPHGESHKRVQVDDSQSALEALRHAVAAYHAHRSASGVSEGDIHSMDPFAFPTLEYLSSVCQTEAVAMRRVQRFCEELPEVLCGKSCVLFEAVTFFNARCVETMSRCVLRFSKNLPIIVNRVVKNRKRYVRYTHNKANSGLGTGDRPHQQRIEDMVMKPLVLVGVLIFDQDSKTKVVNTSSHNDKKRSNDTNCKTHENGDKSTCGALTPGELKICEELKCTIYPSDSIGDITEKIGKWEASSFERLQLELAMVDTTTLISNILELHDHNLAVMHHLHLSKEISERVSLTLQKILCGLCLFSDENPGDAETMAANQGEGEREKGKEMEMTQDVSQRVTLAIHRCRNLATHTASHIEGNITITWDADTTLVESAEEVSAGNEETMTSKSKNEETSKGFTVTRHMSCCTAEIIRFALSVKLSSNFVVFLNRLIAALASVLEQAESSLSLLPKLLQLRDGVVQEEFIPLAKEKVSANTSDTRTGHSLTGNDTGELPSVDEGMNSFSMSYNALTTQTSRTEEEQEAREYRYRGPIRCFPRIFSMGTLIESVFWRRLHEYREYLAYHAPAMNPINLYYNCLPYKPHTHAMPSDRQTLGEEDDALGGWVGETEDGADDAVITQRELDSSSAFRDWLEEVVEQSSLNKECHRIINDAGVGYVTRDPTLPLPQYLSFVKVFCASTAVRSVIEPTAGASRIATPEDTGLLIVVGTECDMRDGGRLLVPWWMDPSLLLALLQESNGGRSTLLEDGLTSNKSL